MKVGAFFLGDIKSVQGAECRQESARFGQD
jgi:hypothetical protein